MTDFEITLGKFNNSMNFALGLAGADIVNGETDILNNPYVEFNAYSMTSSLVLSHDYELEVCPEEYLLRFMKNNTIPWYPQALCFKRLDTVSINKNWFESNANFPAVGMSYCRNTTANGDWCKSKDEIDDWLKNHPEYFSYQETRFLKSIWEDDPIVDEFPYNGDRENYFPT